MIDKIEKLENPWRNADVLEYLYHGEGYSSRKVASELGCSKDTILKWLDRHDIPTREQSTDAAHDARRIPRATYRIDEKGYEKWVVCENGNNTHVRVHSLLAIADGADPNEVFGGEGINVHHSAGHRRMNIPGYVEVLSESGHRLVHKYGSYEMTDEGFPVLVVDEEKL